MLAAPLAVENPTSLPSLAFAPYRDVAMRFFFDAFMMEPASLVSAIRCFKDYIGTSCRARSYWARLFACKGDYGRGR